MSQAETVVLPGRYCAAAGQVRLLHELRMHPEFIGGELRAFAEKRAEKDAEKRSLFGS